MAGDYSREAHVLIFLEASLPEVIAFPERRVVLTESKPTLEIGRASGRPSLGLQSQATNGWFDSPVMSREHARITADIGQQTISIVDLNSMHGTLLNGEKLSNLNPRRLNQGDKLVFGIAVYRNQRTFQPTEVKVGIQFHKAPRSTTSPSRIFTVPDDCSTDENEAMEEDVPVLTTNTVMETTASTLGVVDAHNDSPARSSAIPQVDGPADAGITLSGALNILHPDHETASDDDESIRLTESSCSASEYSSQSPTRPQSLGNVVEAAPMAYGEDADSSWANNSADEADEGIRSEDNSVHQEDVFIYDSEDSDESDRQLKPFTGFGPEDLLEASATMYPPAFRPFSLPPLSEALPWTSGSEHRIPSPYTITLPYPRCRIGGRELEPPQVAVPANINGMAPTMAKRGTEHHEVSVQSLGQLSGKLDFFQAREHNKMALAEATMVPLDHARPGQKAAAAAMDDLPLADWFPASAFELQRFREQQQETWSDPWSDESEPSVLPNAQPSAGSADTSNQVTSGVSCAGSSRFSGLGGLKIMDEVEPRVMETQKIYGGRADSSRATDRYEMTKLPATQFSGKGKRKADEISGLTEAEMNQFGRNEASSRPDHTHTQRRHLPIIGGSRDPFISSGRIVPTPPPVESSPVESAQSSLPSPTTTPDKQADSGLRPNKRIKRLVERVGFAALGGATIGALVFSSLVYTAPDFV